MNRTLVAVVAFALALTGSASAHVEVVPGVVAAGESTLLRIELPLLRPGPPPEEVAVLGRGVEQLSVVAAGRAGDETRWRAQVRVDAEPGPVTLVLRARFPDGRTVDVRQAVTVVPSRGDDGGNAPLLATAAFAALAALAGAALALRRASRRRPAP